MDSEPTPSQPPAILVVTCSISSSGSINSTRDLAAPEENPKSAEEIAVGAADPVAEDKVELSTMSAADVAEEATTARRPPTETASGHVHSMAKAPTSILRLQFCAKSMPHMSGKEPVRYLSHFRFGDTYKLKSRSWLLPQFLSGVLTLVGVVLTLVGIISLQINKYLHACDSEDGLDCQSNKANINNVMMPIGVGSTGGGLSLILISGFVFVHAFCVIYEDGDNEDENAQDGVLHIPVSQRAALLGSSAALAAEASLARCHSYYDNLEYHVAL